MRGTRLPRSTSLQLTAARRARRSSRAQRRLECLAARDHSSERALGVGRTTQLNQLQIDCDVAARGIGIRAYAMRRLQQRFGFIAGQLRNRRVELDREPETLTERTDRDARRDRDRTHGLLL